MTNTFLQITRFLALLAALGLSTISSATVLKPYHVEYLTKQWGMKVKLVRELSAPEPSQYVLRETGKVMLQKLVQESRFSIDGSHIMPDFFSYELSGVVSRSREITFPGDNKPVRSLYKGKWYDIPWRAGMLDRLSQQEQVRLYLMESTNEALAPSLDFTVVDGRKVKDYTLDLIGEEKLSTALGDVRTLHYTRKHPNPSRKTDIWLAPRWDYLMVRTVHVEDGKPIEAVITGGNIDGVSLSDIKP